MTTNFEELVELKFQVYNSLFLDLPFEQTYQTGIYLPLLAESCRSGFSEGKGPEEIIRQFFDDYFPSMEPSKQLGMLFRFTQYIERQVLLFDSVEDAAFNKIHDIGGKGSINQVIDLAIASGKKSELLEKLDNFGVRVVLTAHPTQFYPSQVLGIQTELQHAIKKNDVSSIKLLLNQLGKTPFFKKEKPSPYDEALRLTWYLQNVFYESMVDIIENICQKLGTPVSEWTNFDLMKVGFWPGGDRDGNPFVTPQITIDVARRLKHTVMMRYLEDLRLLRRRLTFSGVEEIINEAGVKVYNTIHNKDGKQFFSAGELLDDLNTARKNLVEKHDGLFVDRLDRLILKVRLFGFNMASLDIRQDSRVHRKAWTQLLEATSKSTPDYDSPNAFKNILSLDRLPLIDGIAGDEGKDLLKTLEVVKLIQEENGEKGCHRYIISNCRSAVDIAILFKTADLVWAEKDLNLDIIPLFESVDDLTSASKNMEILFRNKDYMQHLSKRGMMQTVMLGFSDGTKDGGYLQANWSIFKAKEGLSQCADEFGVKLVFFDGRGGPPSRGGGNTHNFYAALGDRIHNHQIELTVQGQTISSHYGQPNSCRFNLEQLLTAGIENAIFFQQSQSLNEKQRDLIEELCSIGYQQYNELKAHPSFLDYLEKITPLRFFGETNVASRPTRRNGGKLTLSDLRAIPFVGSWSQMKQNVPGFYGVGSAIKSLWKQGRRDELMNLYKESLFFRTLLGNSMQSLEKATFKVTNHISKDPEFGPFWHILHKEYLDSIEYICKTTGQSTLMTENPDIKKSIGIREDIVLPLITIQQFALYQLRRSGEIPVSKDILEKLVIRTMFGIINASRNAA